MVKDMLAGLHQFKRAEKCCKEHSSLLNWIQNSNLIPAVIAAAIAVITVITAVITTIVVVVIMMML
jgi:hypothetical protein